MILAVDIELDRVTNTADLTAQDAGESASLNAGYLHRCPAAPDKSAPNQPT